MNLPGGGGVFRLTGKIISPSPKLYLQTTVWLELTGSYWALEQIISVHFDLILTEIEHYICISGGSN
jgi:hypothetical protein